MPIAIGRSPEKLRCPDFEFEGDVGFVVGDHEGDDVGEFFDIELQTNDNGVFFLQGFDLLGDSFKLFLLGFEKLLTEFVDGVWFGVGN